MNVAGWVLLGAVIVLNVAVALAIGGAVSAAIRCRREPPAAAPTPKPWWKACDCDICNQLDEDAALGVQPLDISLWETELTR